VGFTYDIAGTLSAGDGIVQSIAELSELLAHTSVDVHTRLAPSTWSVHEYSCHIRDVLLARVAASSSSHIQRIPTVSKPAQVRWATIRKPAGSALSAHMLRYCHIKNPGGKNDRIDTQES
jgi:hypothetical protein